jgi:CubicO group peptidase (beta-lactamase class C family)
VHVQSFAHRLQAVDHPYAHGTTTAGIPMKSNNQSIPRARADALIIAVCALAFAGPLRAANDVEARIERVNQGLRPVVSIVGDDTWSLDERMRHYGVPGVAITVIENNGIAWTRVYGLADRETGEKFRRDTLFQAGSVSKPVAAFGAMRLVQYGKLDLHAPVNEGLKAWRIPDNEFTAKTPVTLEHLLSHTGGLTVHGFGGYGVGTPVPTIAQILDGEPPANSAPVRVVAPPGTIWRYSGGGYTIAQMLMSEATGQDFAALMKKQVLKPIGMQDSTYQNPLPDKWLPRAAAGVLPDGTDVPGKRHTYPEMAAAGLWTTSRDLALFALEMQKSLKGKSELLTRESATAMLKARADGQYGLGFGLSDVNGEAYFGHGGWDEGFCANLIAHQRSGQGVVIMINANQPQFMDELMRAVAFEYRWPGFRQQTRVALSEKAAATAPGRYRYNSEQLVRVTLDEGKLYLQYAGNDRTELVPIGPQTFVRREREAPVIFRLDSKDQPELAFELGRGEFQTHARLADDQPMPRELLLAGHVSKAVEAYRKLQEAQDEAASEDYLNNEGIGLADLGRYDASIKILKLNTVLYPNSANTWDSVGYAYARQGDKEQAREFYRKALEIDPKFPSAVAALEKLGE